MFKRRKSLEIAPQERFIYKTKDGTLLDVSHLFRKPKFPTRRLIRNLLLGFLFGCYIVALIHGI